MASDDWELHKNTISHLFLLEKLSLRDVSARMKEEYKFDRKKHQYEYQLKKWGIKKNLRKGVWRYVSYEVRKRKIAGKRSEVTLFGMQLPLDKVRKEVQRYTTIPTAKDFGRDIPSPTNPGSDIFIEGFQFGKLLRVWVITHEPNTWKDLLQVPDMTRLLMTAGTAFSLQTASKNPLALYTEINDLARSIPQNCETEDQNTRASLWTGGPSAIAIESLKVIIFSLANKSLHNLPIFDGTFDAEYDTFVIWFLERIFESNLEWSIHLFGTGCSTTNAILEGLYGCAIRQKRYALISQLLKAGVDPNIPVDIPPERHIHVPILSLKRGKMSLDSYLKISSKLLALEIAIEPCDIRLGTILLDAGADIGACTPSLLERIAFTTKEDDHLEFVQLLIRHGCELELLPALGIAIAKRHNRLAMFLVEKVLEMTVSEQLISYSFTVTHGPDASSRWYELVQRLLLLQIDCTLLHIAIISENTAMVDFLLRTTLVCIGLVSKKELRDLFMVAYLAGDHSTIEQLVILDVDWGGYWTRGVSPLVATAWNPDVRIAEMILQCGAFSDHDIGDFPERSKSPLPIHVATRSGNTNFVQWLIGQDRGLDVQLSPSRWREWHWLVPSRLTSPFQFALESGNVATVIQCRHARLLGGELIQAVRLGDERVVSDLLLREKNITFTDVYGDTVLEAAVEVGNRDIISLYFSSGGKYRSSALLKAVKAALISQDDSIVLLLAMNRPIKIIDAYEASALVIAIREKQPALVIVLLGEQFLPGSVRSFYCRVQFDRGHFSNNSVGYESRGGMTPLYAAFASGDTDITKKILQVGYRARAKDLKYYSAYENDKFAVSLFWSHFPLTNDDLEWTRHLLFYNVRLNMSQRVRECIACLDGLEYYVESRTPLQEAVVLGNSSLVALIIDESADINAPAAPDKGATALQLAAIRGSMNIARSLLERGGDVNAPPAKHRGRTALEGASEHGKLDMVRFLLERGHFALAKPPQEFGGWTDRDQEVYDREAILEDEGYFIFDEKTRDWHFRRVRRVWRKGPCDVDSRAWSLTSPSTADRTSHGDFPKDGDFEPDCDDFEDDEYEFNDRHVRDQDNGMGNITQEQGNNHEAYIPEREVEDKGLLMERYLNSDFKHNWDNFEDDEDEFQTGYTQSPNDEIRDIIQGQGGDQETHVPRRDGEDRGMVMMTQGHSKLELTEP
ncbi:ankyrin repeat-containing domain protein [Xylaria acuta]|nr:ankyrin repeat-containing domain protein [Xylaria acuta]